LKNKFIPEEIEVTPAEEPSDEEKLLSSSSSDLSHDSQLDQAAALPSF
jgi:hypothetical protein